MCRGPSRSSDVLGRRAFRLRGDAPPAACSWANGARAGTLDAGSHGLDRRDRSPSPRLPFCPEPGAVCDPRVAFVVVLRPVPRRISTRPARRFPGLIGRSAAMERIFNLIENLEHSETTVLLTGDSGTGKEVVARAIHNALAPARRAPRRRQLRRSARRAARERALRPRAGGLHRGRARPRGPLRGSRRRHPLPG